MKRRFQKLSDIILESPRIALLADATVGKTQELRHLEAHFSAEDQPLFPIFYSLATYTNSKLEDIIPAEYEKLPREKLLLLLDGFDEVPSECRNFLVREIERYSTNNPNVKIVVSSRTNFFDKGDDNLTGTLRGFEIYKLLPLDGDQIDNILETRLGVHKRDFLNQIGRKRLSDLLRIPFYLNFLIKLFLKKQEIPERRTGIYEIFIKELILADKKKFRTTVDDLEDQYNNALKKLEFLALTMEVLGKNFLQNEEFEELIPDSKERHSLNISSLWIKKKDDKGWQFCLTSYQEFLAARALSQQPFEKIKKLISFEPDQEIVIPTWKNTLAFLLDIIDSKPKLFTELSNWLLKGNQLDVAIRFEPHRLPESKRVEIFKKIYTYYKEKKIYISEKYSYRDLVHFAKSEEVVRFLLEEIQSDLEDTTLSSAIELLGLIIEDFSQFQDQAEKSLVSIILSAQRGEYIIARAILALANGIIFSKENIKAIVEKYHDSNSDWIRYGLYHLLRLSPFLDEYIQFFIKGISLICYEPLKSEGRLLNESMELIEGLKKAKASSSVLEIFTFFIENPTCWHDAHIREKTSFLIQNAIDVYDNAPQLLNLTISFFQQLEGHFLEKEAEEFLIFFDKTKTRKKAFEELFLKQNKEWHHLAGILFSEECFEITFEAYSKGKLNNEKMHYFCFSLEREQPELFKKFECFLKKKTNNAFQIETPLQIKRLSNEEIFQRELQIIFSKANFEKEIQRYFDLLEKSEINRDDLYKIHTQNWKTQSHVECVWHFLLESIDKEVVSIEEIKKELSVIDWNYFIVENICDLMQRYPKPKLDSHAYAFIEKWCLDTAKSIDFQKAVTMKGDRISINQGAAKIEFFLHKLDLSFDEKTLLDMVSFNSVADHDIKRIEFLERKLPFAKIKKRIFEKLKEQNIPYFLLEDYIKFCRRHNLSEAIPLLLPKIKDNAVYGNVRLDALEALKELGYSQQDLETLLYNIKDDIKWSVVNSLDGYSSASLEKYLEEELLSKNDEDRFNAVFYLIQRNDLKGLEYLLNYIQNNSKLPQISRLDDAFARITDIKCLPLLMQLLLLSYNPNFHDDRYNRFNRMVCDALKGISLASEENFSAVRKEITTFIDKYSSKDAAIKFLNSFIERVEQELYHNKATSVTLEKAIEKVKTLEFAS